MNHPRSHATGRSVLLFAVFFSGGQAFPARAADAPASLSAFDARGPFAVDTRLEDWTDAARKRTLPVKVYQPRAAVEDKERAFPVMVLSHGLGGSRGGLSYLASLWASRGFVCVVLQHPGSDDAVWRGKRPLEAMTDMRAVVRDAKPALDRARDVRFALDELERRSKADGDPLRGRLRLDRIGIAGHSFGAWTALTAGGRKLVPPLGDPVDMGDKRIRCVVSLSGQGSGHPARDRKASADYMAPTLHVSGDKDEVQWLTGLGVADRRVPFDLAPGIAHGGGEQILLWFKEADHMVMAGPAGVEEAVTRRRHPERDEKTDRAIQARIQAAATAFVEAHLKDDAAAKAFLAGKGQGTLEALMPGAGSVERK